MLKTLFLMYSLVTLLLWTPVSSAQTAREIASSAFQSVALVVMEDNDGSPVSLGSGLVVGPDLVATNLHVVSGASRGYVRLIGDKKKWDVEGTVGVDLVHDLAILKVRGVSAKPLNIVDSSTLSIGDTVYAIGNPLGLEGTFSQGIVSGIRKLDGSELLQVTAPISPGSSGGPLLNEKGSVVGIAVSTYKAGQNLNFAVPSNYLSALLGQLTAVTPLPVHVNKSAISAPYADIGERATEGVVVTDFAWNNRYNSDFSVSLRNRLRDPVKDVYFRIVFYNQAGDPIETVERRFSEEIPPGLARRVPYIVVTSSVKELAKTMRPRILDFTVVQQ